MKNKSLFSSLTALLLVVLLAFSLVGCSSSEKGSYDSFGGENGSYSDESLDVEGSASSSDSKASDSIKDTRKIIETINYSVQTKSYDKFVTQLENKALSLNGYIESSDVSGNADDDSTPRYATYVFRIPSDKVADFTASVSENSVVTNKTVNTQDVTLEYVDVESRIEALKSEKEALQQLLESAKTTKEIIEIRDMLTEVIYEIESYESRLRALDSQIDFTSITVNVSETEHPQVVKEQTVWQRIATNLMDNFSGVWDFIVEAFVFVVSSTPFILVFAVYLGIIFVIVKLITKKNKKSKAKINKESDK